MEENVTIIEDNKKVRIEKIQSNGYSSDYWYDQDNDEFVIVTKGNAILELEDCDMNMKEGDSYYIRAHLRHRVSYTTCDCEWLCFHFK